jgi:hypothetical protein
VHRSALIPSDESQLLATLAGGELDQMSTDGWAVFVRSAGRSWMFFPEEVAYAEDDPIRDVVRIAIKQVGLEQVTEAREDVGRSLGKVESICVARTLCAFLPGRPVGTTDLRLGERTVEIPPGVRHESVEIAPQRLPAMLVSTPALRDLHFMPADLGLVLETVKHRVLIRTYGFFADPFIDPAPDSPHLANCDVLPLDIPRTS